MLFIVMFLAGFVLGCVASMGFMVLTEIYEAHHLDHPMNVSHSREL